MRIMNMSERKEQVDAILAKVKELLRKGSVTKVIVRDKTGKKIFGFSANVGIAGSLIALHAPILALSAVLLANSAGTTVEVVKTNGEVIDLSGAPQRHSWITPAGSWMPSRTEKTEDASETAGNARFPAFLRFCASFPIFLYNPYGRK